MSVRSFVPSEYFPTSPRSGNSGQRVFRMQNMLLRGEAAEPYAEVYGGSRDLGENIATANLTGTVATTLNSVTVTGTGTAFKTELHLGQRLEIHGGAPDITVPVVVDEIVSDFLFRACRPANAATTGATATKLPRLFEVNKKRGSLLHGNAVEFDLGTLLCVGDGELRLNGVGLSGTSLIASRTPQIALFDPLTGNYSVRSVGLPAPISLTAAAVAGGTKNMQAGVYSIRAAQARLATNGYGNPSPKAEVTIATGDIIRGTFPAVSPGVDAWAIFGDLFTQGGGINGPWYRYQPNPGMVVVRVGAGAGEVPAAGGTLDIEYNDAEIAGNQLLSFNNDPPPHAEFIGVVGGIPVWISCMGPGATSPGPFIAPAKSNNIEAAPANYYSSPSPPDPIIGFYVAQGRLFLLCVNTLQVAVATQTQDARIPPLVVRPYWRAGFKNPDTLLFVDGFLVGMTNHGLARSVADRDEVREEFGFATAVEELLATVNPGHALLALDPKNNAVCLFSSAHALNASGYWTTRVWLFGLRENKWIGDVLLTSTTGDMIVSGAAEVNGHLEFLCGGRQQGGAITVRTYRWDDETAGIPVPYYLAWQFADWGAEDQTKRVGPFFQVIAQQAADGTAGIHGVEPGEAVPVAALETGNAGSKSGIIVLPPFSSVAQLNEIEVNVTNLKQFTVRVDGTWSGVGERDRVDEVVVEATTEGARR